MSDALVDNFGRSVRDLLSPARCRLCANPTQDAALCPACVRDLPWNRPACPHCAQPQTHDGPCSRCRERTPAFDTAWTAFRLEAPVQRELHALKYRAGFLHADLLGTLMAERLLRRAAPLPQLILPVPLHPLRLAWRGYNQALELGHLIARITGIRCEAHRLRRLRLTQDQIGLTLAQRRRNVKGAFRCTHRLDGLHVALLDDVMTTGATLDELARTCRDAGAAKIEAWSAARTP